MRMHTKDWTQLLMALKGDIRDEYRASDEDTEPSMQVTIACDDMGESWSYQTGDNSYMGDAYGLPHWAVISLNRDSNVRELVSDIVSQLSECMPLDD